MCRRPGRALLLDYEEDFAVQRVDQLKAKGVETLDASGTGGSVEQHSSSCWLLLVGDL